MNAFIAILSSQLIAMSTVFADHCHEACFLDTCLLCVTGPSHTHTCQRTPGPTCVVLQHRDLGHGGNGSVHTTSDEVKTRWLDCRVSHKWLVDHCSRPRRIAWCLIWIRWCRVSPKRIETLGYRCWLKMLLLDRLLWMISSSGTMLASTGNQGSWPNRNVHVPDIGRIELFIWLSTSSVQNDLTQMGEQYSALLNPELRLMCWGWIH